MERSTVLIAVFAALIAALGLVPKFTLAFGVPITAQSLGIMLCGTVLGAKRGGAAALLFVVLTLAGLPLLAGGRGGLGLLSGPSVGFIIGFPIAAFVTGWVMERMKTNVLTSSFIASFMGGCDRPLYPRRLRHGSGSGQVVRGGIWPGFSLRNWRFGQGRHLRFRDTSDLSCAT